MVMPMSTAYWEVRQAIVIVAFFGGLRLLEAMDLKLEMIIRSSVGYTITHTRAKQRSDKMSTKFLVPEEGGYASQLAIYLTKVNSQLNIFQGRPWYTGRKSAVLINQAMGRNMVARVPHEVAVLLKLDNPTLYTFHSFRRTSATIAADAGATKEQMVDFFGWKNGAMCQEYISSSKPAIIGMANKLGAVGVETVVCQVGDSGAQEEEDYSMLQEDPELLIQAGISCTTISGNSPDQQNLVENAVKQAVSAVPAESLNNLTLKVVVINNMSGTTLNM
jgi:hypothetical protein